jgi:hypothetical protein
VALRAKQAELDALTKPKPSATIEQVLTGTSGDREHKILDVLLFVTVRNGGAPSMVGGYSLTVKPVTGGVYKPSLPVILEADADLSVCFDRLAIEGGGLVLPLFHSIQRRLRQQGVAV